MFLCCPCCFKVAYLCFTQLTGKFVFVLGLFFLFLFFYLSLSPPISPLSKQNRFKALPYNDHPHLTNLNELPKSQLKLRLISTSKKKKQALDISMTAWSVGKILNSMSSILKLLIDIIAQCGSSQLVLPCTAKHFSMNFEGNISLTCSFNNIGRICISQCHDNFDHGYLLQA